MNDGNNINSEPDKQDPEKGHEEDNEENRDSSRKGPRNPTHGEKVLGIDQSRKKEETSSHSDAHDAYSGWAAESNNELYDREEEKTEGPESSNVESSGRQDESQALESLRKELERTKEKYVRAVAETENLRKRTTRERQDVSKYAITSFARDLLDFADNFQRALESLPDDLKEENERVQSIVGGIQAMERELSKMFEKHGIRKLEPLNEKFDPNFHEVMFEIPSSDQPAGTIVQLVEPGYMIHDRLLRPARVGVAKDGESPEGNAPSGGQNIDEEF